MPIIVRLSRRLASQRLNALSPFTLSLEKLSLPSFPFRALCREENGSERIALERSEPAGTHT